MYQELNLGPLQEQYVLFTAKLSSPVLDDINVITIPEYNSLFLIFIYIHLIILYANLFKKLLK